MTGRALRWAWLMLLAATLGWTAAVGGGAGNAGPSATDAGWAELDGDPVAAAVGWPPSTGLLIGEVVTRGGAASDQYVEIYNAASVPLDLADLELVYVTASGATVTRKQAWAQLLLEPGRRLLVANAAGSYAAQADGVFSGGFSTTGGSLVLRTLGGSVIDALSWGSATNSFVETRAGPAPATGQGLERLPGAEQGNGLDTNDNQADTRVTHEPLAQNLAAPAQPPPSPATSPTAAATAPNTPSASSSASPTDYPYEGEPSFTDEWPPDPSPTGSEPPATPTTSAGGPSPTAPASTATTTAGALPTPTAQPTASVAPTAPPAPAPTPTVVPTPTVPPTATVVPTATSTQPPITAPPASPTPTAAASSGASPATPWPTATGASPSGWPTPTGATQPSSSPTATPLPIGEARAMTLGSLVTVAGTLTTPTGLTEAGKGAFVQDVTGGIALYLADGSWPAAQPGTSVLVSGSLETRFSLLTLRLAGAGDIAVGQAGAQVPALALSIDEVGELVEGRLVTLEGVISESPSTLSDGFSTTVVDDTGSLRVVVATASGIAADELSKGRHLRLTGVVGQRDSSGTGFAGYRLHPRSAADIVMLAMPSASPSPTLRPTPTPRRSGAPTGAPTARPTGTAAAQPISIAAALRRPGEPVTVEGVVTGPATLLDADGRRVTIQDGSAAILLRLPIGAAVPAVGDRVRATGEVGTYYGAPQLAAADEPRRLGRASLRASRVDRAPIAAALEWRLVMVSGVVESVQRSGDAWRAELAVSGGKLPIVGLARSGIGADALEPGRRATVTGIVRRAYPTAVDQRLSIVPRTAGDIRLGAVVAPPLATATGRSADGAARGTAGSTPDTAPAHRGAGDTADQLVTVTSVAELAGLEGRRVRIGGTVVLADGTRLIIRDATGSASLHLAGDATSLAGTVAPGAIINAVGIVDRDQRGALVVVVSAAADVRRAGQPGLGAGSAASSPAGTVADGSSANAAGAGAAPPAEGLTPAVVAVLGALALLGLVTGSAGVLMATRARPAVDGRRRPLAVFWHRTCALLWRITGRPGAGGGR